MRNNAKISVSGRAKQPDIIIGEYIKEKYPEIDIADVDYVFGFREENPMNGGRDWVGEEITDRDLSWMYDNGIGLKLPLSNQFTTEEDYTQFKWLFEKYHRKGNAIIASHNWMAERIKNDFPDYQVEASTLMKISTLDELANALTVFDVACPWPMFFCKDEILANVPDKSRVRLFSRMFCGATCANPVCYISSSKKNRHSKAVVVCSARGDDRNGTMPETTEYNVEHYIDLGYTLFKTYLTDLCKIRRNDVIYARA